MFSNYNIVVKAVLFDLDNTLTDYVKIKTKCVRAAINAMVKAGLSMNPRQAFEILMDLYRESYYESTHIFEEFLMHIHGVINYKLLGAAIVAYRKVRYLDLKPYKNVKKTLKKLQKKGLKLGIITDAPRTKAWIRLTGLGIIDFFNFVIGYEDTNYRKPHPLPFKKAIKIINLKPEEILYVGDNPSKDIKGARRVGMKTALAKYGQFIPGNTEPDYVLKDISDLLKIVI